MEQEKHDFKILCYAILLVIEENRNASYLPEWLFSFWQKEASNIDNLKEEIHGIIAELEKHPEEVESLKVKLIERLDLERYDVTVHLQDERLRSRIQDAMVAALFFSQVDVQKYNEYVVAEQESEKFITHLYQIEELISYKEYLKKQQSIYGRFAKNFTDNEITLAAKGYMINGKLLEHYGFVKFIQHGFFYVKKELKALQISRIEKGYLNEERINSYMEKISFLLHPANELHEDKEAFVKYARNLLEDIINTAGIKEGGKESEICLYQEHEAIIHGCYWVDEMFKTASASLESFEKY
jgi:hypothetical protein